MLLEVIGYTAFVSVFGKRLIETLSRMSLRTFTKFGETIKYREPRENVIYPHLSQKTYFVLGLLTRRKPLSAVLVCGTTNVKMPASFLFHKEKVCGLVVSG
jgi:hypothetical protein